MEKLRISHEKLAHLKNLSDENDIIGALAIDQRGSLKKMLASGAHAVSGNEALIEFKQLISSQLTPYATSILLDPEFGVPATKLRAPECGLIVAYEKQAMMRQQKVACQTCYQIGQPNALKSWALTRSRF